MRELALQEVELIDGGFWEALAVFVLIFTFPKVFTDQKKQYAEWGEDASRDAFDQVYPYDPNSNERYGPPGHAK